MTTNSEHNRGCPCLYATPCNEQCACVVPHSSRGCRRCCRYGSRDQREATAMRLVAAQDAMPLMLEAIERALRVIDGLSEQQAMPSDWYKADQEWIRATDAYVRGRGAAPHIAE